MPMRRRTAPRGVWDSSWRRTTCRSCFAACPRSPTPQAVSVASSPDALVGRLYAAHGHKDRLTSNSPPRNVLFGTRHESPTRRFSDNEGSDHTKTASGGRLQGSDARHPFAKTSSSGPSPVERDDTLVQPFSRSSDALAPSASKPQRRGIVNSPPRIGQNRGPSAWTRSPSSIPSASLEASASASRKDDEGGLRRAAATGLSPLAGSSALSRSERDLGQSATGRSTLAIVNTRDGDAPYLLSDRMSPKPSRREASPRCASVASPFPSLENASR